MKLVYNKSARSFSKSFAYKPVYYVMINNKELESPKTLNTINKAIVSCGPNKFRFYQGKGFDTIGFNSREDAENYEKLLIEKALISNGFKESQIDAELDKYQVKDGILIKLV